MGVMKLKSGHWRLQIRRKGLQVDQVYVTEQEAQEAEEQHLARKPLPEPPDAEQQTLEWAWTKYKDSVDFLHEKRPRTQDTESSRIKRILRCLGSYDLREISSEKVEAYIALRLKDDPTPSRDAIRLEVAALSALLNYCRDRHWIAANPCKGVKRPAGAIKPRRMSKEEEGALIAMQRHPNFRFRAAARLCLLVRETGGRPGEWRRCTYADIDLEGAKVIFRDTKYRGQPRTVPLTKSAIRLLTEQLADLLEHSDLVGMHFVFPVAGVDGAVRPMHYTGALRDAKKKGLLPKSVRAHTGRHEYVSHLLESSDLDDARVMALVGHHSPASLEVYKHVRNIRFLPQLESVEPERRKQRIASLAEGLGIHAWMVEALLVEKREEAAKLGDEDLGEELLYTSEILDELERFANRFGKTPEERRNALARRYLAAAKARGRAPTLPGAMERVRDGRAYGEKLFGFSPVATGRKRRSTLTASEKPTSDQRSTRPKKAKVVGRS